MLRCGQACGAHLLQQSLCREVAQLVDAHRLLLASIRGAPRPPAVCVLGLDARHLHTRGPRPAVRLPSAAAKATGTALRPTGVARRAFRSTAPPAPQQRLDGLR
eukprot:scaffold22404_cov112-Isochrysis_galbana.AAC.6